MSDAEEKAPLKAGDVELEEKSAPAPEPAPEPASSDKAAASSSEDEGGGFKPSDVWGLLKAKQEGWEWGKTDLTTGLTAAEAASRLEKVGPNEIPEHEVPWYCRLASQFTFPLAIITEMACILSLIVWLVGDPTEFRDFIIIISLVCINAAIGFYEEQKAHTAMMELKNSVKQVCVITRDGKPSECETSELVPGDLVLVKGGMLVPADCVMITGEQMDVDNSALTGESRLIKMVPGSFLLSGGTVRGGDGTCLVQLTGTNTMIGQAESKMSEGAPKGNFTLSVENAVNLMVSLTIIDCFWIVSIDVLVHKQSPITAVSVIVSLLVASVPVALPMVTNITLSMGAHNMSQHKAIVTHLEALQDISSMDVLCSDKTGTLTTAQLSVYPKVVHAEEGFTKEEVLMWAAVASNEDDLNDAVDSGIFRGYDMINESRDAVHAFTKTRKVPFSPVVKRIVVYCEKDGIKYRIAKGIFSKILKTGKDGGDEFECNNLDEITPRLVKVSDNMTEEAFKTIAVAVENITEGTGMKFCGLIPMRDPPREDTADVIASVRASKIAVKMITGDHRDIAIKTAQQIGLGDKIYAASSLGGPGGDALIELADGFAQVLPVDKYNVVRSLQEAGGHTVGMTGDGVNDAAALARANIGIAVADATDAARRAADIILTQPGLGAIYAAILESRRIFKRLMGYLIYRLGSTIFLVLQISCMFYIWAFNVTPFAIILIALFCDLAVLVIAYDWQHPGLVPTNPSLKRIMTFATVFGCTLFMQGMWWFLFSGYTFNYYSFEQWGLQLYNNTPVPIAGQIDKFTPEMIEYAMISNQNLDTMMFHEMSCSSLLAIFPARTKGPFFMSMANPVITFSSLFFMAVTVVLTLVEQPLIQRLVDTKEMSMYIYQADKVETLPAYSANYAVLYCWIYMTAFLFLLDLAKMTTYLITDPHVYRSRDSGKGCRCHCWGIENLCCDKTGDASSEPSRITGPGHKSKAPLSQAPLFDDNIRT